MNYYEILRVAPTATGEEIREAYIALCKDLHPDKLADVNENVRKLAEEQLKLVNQAYETLKDEQLRAQYDRDLANQRAGIAAQNQPSSPNLDELLSSAVLDEGFQVFVQEEDTLWHHFLEELQQVRNRYGIGESANSSVNFFPDDFGMKVSRIGSLIFSGIIGMGLAMIIFAIIAGVIAFVIGFAINVFLFPLGVVVVWLYFYVFLPLLVIVYFGVVLSAIFSGDEVTDEDCREREKTECIFSKNIHRYWLQTEDFGANFRAYKIFSEMYPSHYVQAVNQKREEFSKKIKELLDKRKEKVKFFKDLPPSHLTAEYVSGLSPCERLLLMKALQQKAEEAQQQAENEELANFLRVAGAVVLLGMLFGGGGGF